MQTSYDKLICEIIKMFQKNSDKLLRNQIKGYVSNEIGSYHCLKDKKDFLSLIEKKGYNTPIKELINKI